MPFPKLDAGGGAPKPSNRQKLLAAGGIGVVALALYMRSRSGGGGTSTTGPQGTFDSTAADAAKYADQGDQGLADALAKAQNQIDAQGQRLAWAGAQLHHQGDLIHQLQHPPKTPPKTPTNLPRQRPGGKVKNEPVWAGAKLPLRRP